MKKLLLLLFIIVTLLFNCGILDPYNVDLYKSNKVRSMSKSTFFSGLCIVSYDTKDKEDRNYERKFALYTDWFYLSDDSCSELNVGDEFYFKIEKRK